MKTLIPALLLSLIAVLQGCEESDDSPPQQEQRGQQEAAPDQKLAGPKITVDWASTHQRIVGFGGTMGWIHPHPAQREEVFDLLFDKLGVSVLRIRALGGEGGDELSLEPRNDNDDPNTFNWPAFPIKTTEAKNAIIIKAAAKRGVKTIIPVTWSPPGWMKDSGSRAWGGELKPELLDEYAELWAAYVIGMKREFDVDVRMLSIQNEPDMEYYYPTCGWSPELYARAVGRVEARLKREGLEVRVLGPDTCRIYNMPRYVEAMEKAKASPGTPILTHLYDLSIPYERVDRDAERWRKARDVARGHKRALWLMETANYLSSAIDRGSYDEAMIWAQKIHWALTQGDCEVVCYWALFFDKPGEALIYCKESEHDEYEITPKFYTSMNYFRFVRPGMVRYTAQCEDEDLLVSAFRGEGGERVIVIVNPGNAEKPAAFARKPGDWRRFETTPVKKCVLTEWRGDGLLLPARSVTTLVHTAP